MATRRGLLIVLAPLCSRVLPGAMAQQGLSSIGAVGEHAAVCPLGHYDHDEDASTDCLACPAGKFSQSPRAISRPQLDAGGGDLALDVDNGDSQRLFSLGDPSSNPHPDGGWNFATTSCHFDDCIAECTCALDCDDYDLAPGGKDCEYGAYAGATVYDLPGWPGMNGLRRCGATSQMGVLHAMEPGKAIDGNPEQVSLGYGGPMGVYVLSSCFWVVAPQDRSTAWWQIDLGARARLERMRITHLVYDTRFRDGMMVYVSDVDIATHLGDLKDDVLAVGTVAAVTTGVDDIETVELNGHVGRFVSLRKGGGGEEGAVAACELEIYGSIGCIDCPRGKFASAQGSRECEPCPVGTFARAGAAECLPCAAGEFQGELECLVCAPGQYDHDSQPSTPCELCPVGRFSTASGQAGDESVCTVCPAGKSSAVAGATLCVTCGPSQYDHDNDGSTPCLNCPAGSIRAPCIDDWTGELFDQQRTCLGDGGSPPWDNHPEERPILQREGCSAIKFSGEGGLLAAGHTAADICPVSCDVCTSGTLAMPDGFGNDDGTGPCTACRAGTYVASGQIACLQCQPGAYDHDSDASTPCELCPANTFSRGREATTCTPCPPQTVAEPGATKCTCSTGSPVVNADDIDGNLADLQCTTCPAGTVHWSRLGTQDQLEHLADLDLAHASDAAGRSRKTCQELCAEDEAWCALSERRGWSMDPRPVDDATVCASHRVGGMGCFHGGQEYHGQRDTFEEYHGFEQAEAVCSAIGARLCTVDEIRTNEGDRARDSEDRDSDCGRNDDPLFGWSSDECQVDICGEGAVTTGGTAPEGTPCTFPFVFDGVVYNECMWAERDATLASIYDLPSMEGPVCLTGTGVDGKPPTVNLDTLGGWYSWTTVHTEHKELRHGNPGNRDWDRWSQAGISLENSRWPLWGHCNCDGVANATTHAGHLVAVRSQDSNWHERRCPLHCDPQQGEQRMCNGVDPSSSEFNMTIICPGKCVDHSSSKPSIQCCADSQNAHTVARCSAFAACAGENRSTDGMSGACYQAAFAAGLPTLSPECQACWTAGMVDRPAAMCAACVADFVAVHQSCVSSPPSNTGDEVIDEQHSLDISCVQCQPGTYDHDSDASTSCKPCPPSTYSDSYGATACTPCEPGHLAPARSTSADSCVASPRYTGCWRDRESLTEERDLPDLRRRMGVSNVHCQDLVDLMGCDANMTAVSPGLGATVSTICPVTCASCPEETCIDTNDSYDCEDVVDFYDSCDKMPDATLQTCQLTCGLCTPCRDDPDGLLVVAVAPSISLCRQMCKGYRYMGVQGADLCFCSDSFGQYGAAPASRCGDTGGECAHNGSRELVCSQSVTVKIHIARNSGSVHDVGEEGYHWMLRSWIIDNLPTKGDDGNSPVSQSGCKQSIASGGDEDPIPILDPNCPVAVAGGEMWSPLLRKQGHEFLYDVPVSSASEHTFYFWGFWGDGTGGWDGGWWEILDSCGGRIGGGPTEGLVTQDDLPVRSFTWSAEQQCCGGCELVNAVFELPEWDPNREPSGDATGNTTAASTQPRTMGDDGTFAGKTVVSIQAACAAERAACVAADGCTSAFTSAVASPERPPPAGAQDNDEALALLVCLQQVASPSLALPRGCTDSLATNYDPEAVDPDPTNLCAYDCAMLSSNHFGGLPVDTECLVLPLQKAPASPWTSTNVVIQGYGPKQSPLGTAPADCRFELVAGEELSFGDAEARCVAGGGHLASIHTEAQDGAITRAVEDGGTGVWIGLHDRANEAGCNKTGFVWTDGSQTGSQLMWGMGKPDAIGCRPVFECARDCEHAHPSSGLDPASAKQDEDCVALQSWDWNWHDMQCFATVRSICGFQCPGTSDPTARCDYEVQSLRLTWDQAEDSCVAKGGHLASITSDEDLARLQLLIVGEHEYWVGLSDRSYEMGCDGMDGKGGVRPTCDPPTADCRRDRDTPGWAWSDGTLLSNWTLWGGSEPGSEHCGVPAQRCTTDCAGVCLAGFSTEDCVELHQQQWDDVECTDEKPFVCGYPCDYDESMAQMDPVAIVAGNLTTRYVQFQTSLTGYSAAIKAANATLQVVYSQFIGLSQVAAGAAALLAAGAQVRLEYAVIERNTNTGRGSAGVYITSRSNLVMTHTRFEANVARDEMRLDAINEMLALSTVTRAGGLVVDDRSTAEVSKCRFLRNRGGSVVITALSNATLLNSVFRGNVGGDPGSSRVASGGVSVWLGSSAIVKLCLFERNRGETAGDMVAQGAHTTAVVDQTVFRLSAAHTITSPYAAGVMLVEDGATATVSSSTFASAEASGPRAAGALYVSYASLVLTDSELKDNSQAAQTTPAVGGSGGLYSETSHIAVTRTALINNTAVAIAAGEFGDHIFSHSPVVIEALDVLYQPYIESQSAFIQPGAVLGSLRGSCKEVDPCQPGYFCTYDRYGLTCTPCPGETVSYDGLQCEPCPMGTGPMANRSGCVGCQGSNHSTFGVCVPCSETMVVDDDAKGCHECGVHRTAVVVGETTALGAPRVCGCDDNYINSSEVLHVCYSDGFDRDQRDRAIAESERSASTTGQECEACPTDITGADCLICEGGKVWLAAGFTIPTLPQSSERRQLSLGADDATVSVFRCHIELELAQARCPANPEVPGTCSKGYTGYLCDSCEDGYGMSPDRACEPCSGAGYTTQSFLVLSATLGGFTVAIYVLGRVWKTFRLKHLARCAFQPGRIIITYSQVTSQLGDVLDFRYPGLFGEVVDFIRPIMDLWGLLFRALGPSECFGVKGFTAKWLLRVVGLPVILSAIVALIYLQQRLSKSVGPSKAAKAAQGQMFMVVFFCYPTICIVSFAAFICRQLTEDTSVLEADDAIICEDPSHKALQGVSVGIIILIAFGMPVLFGLILWTAARNYQRNIAKPNEEIAKRMADELDVPLSTAEYVVRDVTIGQNYSFLMDAYEPRYLYWEALDMLRKLVLVGLVLLVGRGTVAQLAAAIILSFGFFSLQMITWPYKIKEDNLLRASTELHVFVVISTALFLKQDLSWEAIGVDVYDMVLFVSFVLLVPIGFISCIISKMRYVQEVLSRERDSNDALQRRQLSFDLQALGLAADSDREALKRYVDGWFVRGKFAVFLSHFKDEAAAEARILKTELVKRLRAKEEQIFLDSDNLSDLRKLLDSVAESDAVVMLYTRGVLSRPWCLLELQAAAKSKTPLILMRIANSYEVDPSEALKILDDLPAFLDKYNPSAGGTLAEHKTTADAIAVDIRGILTAASKQPLIYDPHQSAMVMQSQMQSLAAALVSYACPENDDLLPDLTPGDEEHWHGLSKQYSVYIMHEDGSAIISEQAFGVKDWLVSRTALTDEQVVTQGDLQDDSSRNANDCAEHDCRLVAMDVDCVLLVQTAHVLQQPRCLARLYTAVKNNVSIVPVVLLPTDEEHTDLTYNFEEVKSFLNNLDDNLDQDAQNALYTACGVKAIVQGGTIATVLPNVISKPLGLYNCDIPGRLLYHRPDINAQMVEIEQTLRRAINNGTPPVNAGETKICADEEDLVPAPRP